MTNTSTESTSQNVANTRQQVYVVGGIVGLLFGLISAYVFNRAAHDTTNPVEAGLTRVKTGDIITLALAAIALVRQIAEIGRPEEPPKRRR